MDRKVIAAVSGGPDSMALLHWLYLQGFEICIVHVNYHKRPTALRDEQIVADFAASHHIQLKVVNAGHCPAGNFQSWARQLRYNAFFEAAREFGTKTIYVAHHLDDHLETWLLQASRGMLCEHYGLASTSLMQGFTICRPFLHLEKRDLETYCKQEGIAYGIDESNLENDYMRNRIRHALIEKMTADEKQWMSGIIAEKNLAWNRQKVCLQQAVSEGVLDAGLLKRPDGWLYLDWLLSGHTGRHYARSHMESLCEQLLHGGLVKVDGILLENWKNTILAAQDLSILPVKIQDENSLKGFAFHTPLVSYKIGLSNQLIETFWLSDSDFPLTIRPVQPGDAIVLREGRKKLSRFFIDRKIPRILRPFWLVVENAQKEIIFVPRLGCCLSHFRVKQPINMLQCISIKF